MSDTAPTHCRCGEWADYIKITPSLCVTFECARHGKVTLDNRAIIHRHDAPHIPSLPIRGQVVPRTRIVG